MKQNIKNISEIVLGCLISAIGVNMFIINSNLFSGGVSGIGILLNYVFSIPAGLTVIVLNIPLLLLSFFKLDRRFTIFSVIGTVSLGIFLIITSGLKNVVIVNDVIFYSIYGGVVTGIGHGLAYANHGSEGGMDIIVMLVKRKYENFHLGQLGFLSNCIIIGAGAAINGVVNALYSIIIIFISGYVTDRIIHGLRKKKVLIVITDKYEELYKYVTQKKYQGVAILNEQKISGENKKVLYCVVHVSQLPEFKFKALSIDKNVLISVIDASEVDGRGIENI